MTGPSLPLGATRPAVIVGLVPARNEAPLIGQCLRALALVTDAIVCLDDASTDGTLAIMEELADSCRIRRILRNRTWHRDEPTDRNALLEAGRAVGGTHFVAVDADEMLTANWLVDERLRRLIRTLAPGDRLALNWIQLWRSVDCYRFDRSVWTWNAKDIVFADDGRARYDSEFIHTARAPAGLAGRRHQAAGYEAGLLHFQFVNWRNLVVKQAWYRCLERLREPGRPAAEINARYAPATDERGLAVRPAPPEWLGGYPFFDPSILARPEGWREAQVLEWFRRYGRRRFRDLDIWDVDWGAGVPGRSSTGWLRGLGARAARAVRSPTASPGRPITAESPEPYRVSALVSVYRAGAHIRGCLEDLVAQTLFARGQLEIVVVDSASPDGEVAVVREFQARHPHVRYARSPTRETIYGAWNRGLRIARGRYLTSANTDDRHRPDALERLADALDARPGVALAYADIFVTPYPGQTFPAHVRSGYQRRPEYSPAIMRSGCHMGPQPLWRRAVHAEVGEFDASFTVAGDYEFWCRLATRYPLHHVAEFLGLYHENPAGVCNANPDLARGETARVQAAYRGHLPESGPLDAYLDTHQLWDRVPIDERVNIGMVTYNRLAFTRQALGAVVDRTAFPYVLSVVDNGSRDGTPEYLRRLHREGVIRHLVLLEENVGVARASNLAWSLEPGAGYYVKLDNDVVVRSGRWLGDMVALLASVSELGAVAYNLEATSYPRATLGGLPVRLKQGAIGGACVMVPRRTWDRLGYWCEEYGLYGEEDLDYAVRLEAAGLRTAYLDDEEAALHLPAGRAAVIEGFDARDGLEEILDPDYRRWKDDRRRQLLMSGRRAEILEGYRTGARPLRCPSLFAEARVPAGAPGAPGD